MCLLSLNFTEMGKTHTIVTCVSTLGIALPSTKMGEFQRGSHSKHIVFANSETAGFTVLYSVFFLQNIPVIGPILLIVDGHSSHT